MKIKGEFLMRQVVGEYVLLPVGDTALKFNGMIALNPVSAFIWEEIEKGKETESILDDILEEFDVDRATASADMEEFISKMKENGFLE